MRQTSHGHNASQHMSGSPSQPSPPTNGVFPSPLPFSLSRSNHGPMSGLPPTPTPNPASASIPRLTVAAEPGPASPLPPANGPGHTTVSASNPAFAPGPGYAPEHAQLATHPMVTHNQDHTRRPKEYPDFVTTRYPLPQGLVTICSNDVEPTSFTQATKDPKWRAAMEDEFNALIRNGTWQLVPDWPHII